MSEPRRDDAVLRFFANGFTAVGWLILTLGGLCTLIFGAVILSDSRAHTSLEDWILPATMLAVGAGCLWVASAIRRAMASPRKGDPDV